MSFSSFSWFQRKLSVYSTSLLWLKQSTRLPSFSSSSQFQRCLLMSSLGVINGSRACHCPAEFVVSGLTCLCLAPFSKNNVVCGSPYSRNSFGICDCLCAQLWFQHLPRFHSQQLFSRYFRLEDFLHLHCWIMAQIQVDVSVLLQITTSKCRQWMQSRPEH